MMVQTISNIKSWFLHSLITPNKTRIDKKRVVRNQDADIGSEDQVGLEYTIAASNPVMLPALGSYNTN